MMRGAIRLPTTPHRAAIAGKVIDGETGSSVAGVAVTIIGMPVDYKSWLDRWLAGGASGARRNGRPDRATTARDGCFCFADLPEGDYTLSFAVPKAKHRYGQVDWAFHLSRAAGGEIALASAEIALPATGVRGRVMDVGSGGSGPSPVSLARIRAEGSGEVAYSDAQGRFYITGIELGARRIRICASGLEPLVMTVMVAEGVVFDVGDLMLKVASG